MSMVKVSVIRGLRQVLPKIIEERKDATLLVRDCRVDQGEPFTAGNRFHRLLTFEFAEDKAETTTQQLYNVGVNVNGKGRQDKMTPIQVAIKKGHLEWSKQLMDFYKEMHIGHADDFKEFPSWAADKIDFPNLRSPNIIRCRSM